MTRRELGIRRFLCFWYGSVLVLFPIVAWVMGIGPHELWQMLCAKPIITIGLAILPLLMCGEILCREYYDKTKREKGK
jgi:hypothetical protein